MDLRLILAALGLRVRLGVLHRLPQHRPELVLGLLRFAFLLPCCHGLYVGIAGPNWKPGMPVVLRRGIADRASRIRWAKWTILMGRFNSALIISL
jgi:hypothetical protein